MALGDRHVVRQPRARQVDRHEMADRAVRPDHAVAHVGRLHSVVEEAQLAGLLVHLRVRGDLAAKRAAEVLGADRLQRHRVHRVGLAGPVPERQQPVVVKHDVGVGGVLLRLARRVVLPGLDDAAPERAGGLLLAFEAIGPNPAVAVYRPPLREVDGVHHAVAVEPVVAPAGVELRVGPVADVDAVQVVGDLALDLELVERQLLPRRSVRPLEVGVELGRVGDVEAIEVKAHGFLPAERGRRWVQNYIKNGRAVEDSPDRLPCAGLCLK